MTRSLRSLRFACCAKLGGADAGARHRRRVVVALMVVPLPTWLLDILLATNVSAAVAILLVVLYVPDAISIATFPTLLLITTLFRLALNVSSTTAHPAAGRRWRGDPLVRAIRGARQLRGRRGGLFDSDAHPVHRHRQRLRARRGSGRALRARCDARQSRWPSTPKRARARSTAPKRAIDEDSSPVSRNFTAPWTAR